MNFLFDAMASLLALFYSFIPSYAMSIILLTLSVMIILTPLTLKGTRSMMMMQQLQPEMRKIQNRYKDDRQKLNEELLKFYKENNINPMGGCLPLLAQMPVFLVLYRVLRGLTRRQSDMGFDIGFATGQAGTGSGPTKPPSLMLDFDPAFIQPTTDLYQSLSQVNVMEGPLGLDLSESASQALSQGVGHFMPYAILIAIVGISGYVQQKQIQGRMPKNQVNPQQQMLMKIMPIMLPVFSFGLPGGLVLYFAVSNLYRIGQQWFISRSIYGIKRGESIDDKRGREGKEVVTAKVTAESSSDTESSRSSRSGGKGDGAKPTSSKASSSKASPSKGDRPQKDKSSAKGGGRTTPSKSAGRSRPSESTKSAKAPDSPVLQPRARKKKR